MNITQKTLESIAFEAIRFRDRIESACNVCGSSNSPLRNYSVKSLYNVHVAILPFTFLDSLWHKKQKMTIKEIRNAIRAYDNLDSHERDIVPVRIGEFVESARGI